MAVLDHLGMASEERDLIARAISGSSHAYLASMDKGLSGAAVWQVKWELPGSGAISALHVFKLGSAHKLTREFQSARDIACPLDDRIAMPLLFVEDDKALLRQPFSGGDPREVVSLRNYVQTATPHDAVLMIRRLYLERLTAWHGSQHLGNPATSERFRDALNWWVARANLQEGARRAGEKAMDRFVRTNFGVALDDLANGIESLLDKQDSFIVGPIHGDLHMQNVLISATGKIHLIDFGWTSERWRAIDFLMMEASLKFMAVPARAALTDLLEMDELIESATEDLEDDGRWDERILFGSALSKIGRCVMEVRKLTLELGAVRDMEQYRRGFSALTYGLCSVPRGINHPYMVASLARSCSMGWAAGGK